MTSGTGLALIPECRSWPETVDYRKKRRCRTNFCFRHSGLYCTYDFSLTTTNTSSMNLQGIYISTASSMDMQVYHFPLPAVWMCRAPSTANTDVQGVSLSTARSMDMEGISFSTASWTCRLYPSSSIDVQVYPLPLPAVWRCRAKRVE